MCSNSTWDHSIQLVKCCSVELCLYEVNQHGLNISKSNQITTKIKFQQFSFFSQAVGFLPHLHNSHTYNSIYNIHQFFVQKFNKVLDYITCFSVHQSSFFLNTLNILCVWRVLESFVSVCVCDSIPDPTRCVIEEYFNQKTKIVFHIYK